MFTYHQYCPLVVIIIFDVKLGDIIVEDVDESDRDDEEHGNEVEVDRRHPSHSETLSPGVRD